MAALDDVIAERARQRTRMMDGVLPMEEFDKTNNANDWVAYICAYAGRASGRVARNAREGCDFRENMVKVGALALAAIEAHDKGYC